VIKLTRGEAIATPHKKTQKTEITELQKNKKTKNCLRRIGVEHLIGRIKIFRVASDRFRLARHKYEQVILSICGLVRVRMERKCILNASS